MEISINGRPREIEEGTGLEAFLAAAGIDRKAIVVEYNQRILAPADYPDIIFSPGDTVEILRFVGGG